MTVDKVTIGDVLFRDIAPIFPGPPRGRQVDVTGDERVALLRTLYQGHLLPGEGCCQPWWGVCCTKDERPL